MNLEKFKKIKTSAVKKVYLAMWEENPFVNSLKIEKAQTKDGESDNSYVFEMKDKSYHGKREELKRIFGIKNKALFDIKFGEACSGSGNELKRITTLHSSSLCSLLFFYNITEENPLVLKIEGEDVTFTKSVFEFQNRVIANRNPSNMDVVLLGMRGNQKVILFLESKFSEYYQDLKKILKISGSYLKENIPSAQLYNSKRIRDSLGVSVGEVDAEGYFSLTAAEKIYLDGIKQMISHYVGVYNFISSDHDKNNDVAEYYNSETQVYLGTILFDKYLGKLNIGKSQISAFESWKNNYRVLASAINQNDDLPDHFKMVPEIFAYSLFENSSHDVEENIKLYYLGEK